MTLQEKLNYEYQCFFLDQMRTSKENIFAHSGEIQVKKELVRQLQFLTSSLDEKTAQMLIPQSNLLESAYCYQQEAEQQEEAETMEVTVKAWLDCLVSRETRK